MEKRKERFIYEKGDLVKVINQCKDCRYNEDKPLSCSCYARIPNGTRSGKVKCPYKEIKQEK